MVAELGRRPPHPNLAERPLSLVFSSAEGVGGVSTTQEQAVPPPPPPPPAASEGFLPPPPLGELYLPPTGKELCPLLLAQLWGRSHLPILLPTLTLVGSNWVYVSDHFVQGRSTGKKGSGGNELT